MDILKGNLSGLNRLKYDELISLVDQISKCSEEEQKKCWELLVKQDFLQNQLNKVVSNPDAKLIEFIANSCKNAICRKFFTKDFLIKCLLELLDSTDYELIKQTCRSIGNICYENDSAVSMVYKNNGIQKIVGLLKCEKLKETSKDEKIDVMKLVFGCLLNLLNDRPDNQEIALEHDLINLIVDALKMNNNGLNQDSLVANCVHVLFCILDNESPENDGSLKNSKLIDALVDQLISVNLKQIRTLNEIENVDLDTVELIIDLITQISRNEEKIRTQIVEKGIIPLLIEILDHELIEAEQVLQRSSDSLVTLVYDETIAKECYNSGKGMVYLKIKHWLDSYIEQFDENSKSNDEIDVDKQNDRNSNSISDNLIERDDFIREKSKPKHPIKENIQLVTSALVIGNFSSNNEDAIAICKDGFIDRLVKITKSTDFKIQLSCLCTLGNLAIPEQNKKYFIENGLLTSLLRLTNLESSTVVSRYVNTLRLVTDKQPEAAFEIVNNHKLIENLKIWADPNSVNAVKSESSRLLASLFKNMKDPNSNHNHLMNIELLQPLFDMVNSEHLQMQSEAINGIGFIINKFEYNQVMHELLNSQFLIDIESLLEKYNKEKELNELESKFIHNILSVLSFGCLKYTLDLSDNICRIMKSLSSNHPDLSVTAEIPLKFKEKQLSSGK